MQTFVVQVKHTGGIVEDVSINLAKRHNRLQRMTERTAGSDQNSDEEGQRAPADLKYPSLTALTRSATLLGISKHTAVIDSIQRTNGSDVIYRESEKEYSFHS